MSNLQSHYERIGSFFGESADPEEMPATCVDTLDRIAYGECDCPWEDHTATVDSLPF